MLQAREGGGVIGERKKDKKKLTVCFVVLSWVGKEICSMLGWIVLMVLMSSLACWV